jgi:hypothetical protein
MIPQNLRGAKFPFLLLGLLVQASACKGQIGERGSMGTGSGGGATTGTGSASGSGPTTGTGSVDPGPVSVPPAPISQTVAFSAVRKVKNLLTGMAPTDDEVAAVTARGPAGLQELIATWMTTEPQQTQVANKMVGFFRNLFQQTGFTPVEDFKLQLLDGGGFDFRGGLSKVGDDAYPRLVQNIQDSFALTAWQIVKEGRPFTETVTGNRLRMTTALKSLYIQIEMPADLPGFKGMPDPAWTIDFSGAAIPIEEAISKMTFSDEAPTTTATGGTFQPTCRGGAAAATGAYFGTAQIFQRLLGHVPRYYTNSTEICAAEAAKPYFTTQDLSDWSWVTIKPKASATDRVPVIRPYDLPALRKAQELTLSLPRVGFYTTPAFLALWNTNDSNQHRVTANQTLLVALGQAFTAENTIVPFSSAGLDAGHAVAGSECVGCHATLDPMRNFWANQYDFNDRNDFPTAKDNTGNPRPTTLSSEFAFGDFRATGKSLTDLGGFLIQVTDGRGLPRFGIAMAQQLCFFANSAPCDESDPEFRRIVGVFKSSNYNYSTLLKELLASPLVTGAIATATFEANAVPVSISRRDHLCAALSNRLGKPDLCAQSPILPTSAQATTAKIASSVASDAFSRGAQSPVTPSDPTLFYSSAIEMLCENVAAQVVDATSGTVWSSSDVAGSIEGMVERVMGYPPSHPLHGQAVKILTDHNAAAVTAGKGTTAANATNALRSTFALACESPTALGIGL